MHPDRRTLRPLLALAVGAMLALTVAACGGDNGDSSGSSGSSPGGGSKLSGEIAGAGSSAQDAAQQAWIAGFQQSNDGVTVSYDPVGSGGGREQFDSGGTAYGGTDSVYSDDDGELSAAQ